SSVVRGSSFSSWRLPLTTSTTGIAFASVFADGAVAAVGTAPASGATRIAAVAAAEPSTKERREGRAGRVRGQRAYSRAENSCPLRRAAIAREEKHRLTSCTDGSVWRICDETFSAFVDHPSDRR